MKTSHWVIIISGFLILALMATNPSLEDHREEVKEMYKKKLSEINKGKKNNLSSQIGTDIESSLDDLFIKEMVSRKNYLIFSITKVTLESKIQNIGYGILGNVFITNYDKINNYLNESMSNEDEKVVNNDPNYNYVIGSPIKIDYFEVAEKDFQLEMNWMDASSACANLKMGWRLPTIDELKIICENKQQIGGFEEGDFSYWSSTSYGSDLNEEGFAKIIHISGCYPNSSAQDGYKKDLLKVRAVRTTRINSN
jgi:hypothetical protein